MSATRNVPVALPTASPSSGAFRLAAWALAACLAATEAAQAAAAPLAAEPARSTATGAAQVYDGVVEAVRQTVLAAQVPGAVVQLAVKVGDRVAAGQLLLRLDARTAEQNAAASDAQVLAARAALDVAGKEVERQRQLFQKNYISQAALDQAEAQFRVTQAQVNLQLAQAGAARTQSGLHVLRAPFAGIVAEVPVTLGDMAMPGRALVTLVDPTALRVSAAVPQSVAARLPAGALPRIELPVPSGASQWLQPLRSQLLPTLDPATHTVQLRADLPPTTPGLAPGQAVRVWLAPAAGTPAGSGSVVVPLGAVVRRAELTALYVLDPQGRPVLRQVRLGRADGQQVEVLAGLNAGERVATDPQAAARAP